MKDHENLPARIKKYQRLDLAANQLETAIGLFISGHDKFSVITLAAAADGILAQLVINEGQENFIDFSLKKDEDKTLTRSTLGKQVNDILFINALSIWTTMTPVMLSWTSINAPWPQYSKPSQIL